jgi:hypothetical protein
MRGPNACTFSFLGDFVQVKLLTRTSVENPVLNQATVGSLYLGWQTTAFAEAIPNAYAELIKSRRQ